MTIYFRDLGPYEGQPTQADLVQMTGETELWPNEELRRVHWGEDGVSLQIIKTRMFTIADQEFYSGEFQPWYSDEWWETYFDCCEAEE
jgi:hypothetical protein